MYWDETEDRYENNHTEEWFWNGCMSSVIALGFFIFAFIGLLLLGGCKSVEYITVPVSHTDTLIITKHQRDSIYMKDSTHVSEQQRGDTILLKITKWRTEYRDREVHDTLYQSKTDTVPVPYPVSEYVEKPLSWWQKTRLKMGEILMVLIGLIGLIGLIKLKTKIWP